MAKGSLKWIFLFAVFLCSFVLQGGNAQVFFNERKPLHGALEVVKVSFPKVVGVGNSGSGTLRFENAEGGLENLRFDVVDGRYERVDIRPFNRAESGEVRFSLRCSDFSQKLILRVSVEDQAGNTSEPTLLQFTCGRPELFNFSDELAHKRPMSDSVRLHFFILADGVTALSENSTRLTTPLLKQPEALVVQALHEAVIPALNGIWDQCGLAFNSGVVRVLDPHQLRLSGGTLASALFQRSNGNPVVVQGVGSSPLSQAHRQLQLDLKREGVSLKDEDLVIFVSGAPILVPAKHGTLTKVEGTSEASLARFALVRWGAAYRQGADITLPRQMVTTLAHEVGHLLGLNHPGTDGLPDTMADPFNLMKGSGVTPEPRAHLLADQCQQAQMGLAQLRFRAQASKNPSHNADSPRDRAQVPETPQAGPPSSPNVQTDKPVVRWANIKPDQRVQDSVLLHVEVDGFDSLLEFGFAEFSYSDDGQHFKQIGLDKTPADGFSVRWDVHKLRKGRYQLKAIVMDAARQQAEATLWVRVR